MKTNTRATLKTLLILALFLAVSISCSNKQKNNAPATDTPLAKAEARMMEVVDEGKLPCVGILTLRNGDIFHQFTYGRADIENEKPLQDDAIYRIYSMSKPITAAALMILYDEGKFQLDDPVELHIPAFKGVQVYQDGAILPQQQLFTIRHLLTHTAGFTYGWGDSYVDSLYREAQGGLWGSVSLEEMMNFLASVPLKHQPGTTYDYSVSIDVAGYLIEVLSGQDLDSFMKDRLFKPLGMKDTGFEIPFSEQERQAMIYEPGNVGLRLRSDLSGEVRNPVVMYSGGGGLVSTLSDYARFGQMLLNGGELEGERVLESSTVELIMSDQMPDAVPYTDGYGLGGSVNLSTGAYGWGGMASTSFEAWPEENMVVLIFTQYVPFFGVEIQKEYHKFLKEALQ